MAAKDVRTGHWTSNMVAHQFFLVATLGTASIYGLWAKHVSYRPQYKIKGLKNGWQDDFDQKRDAYLIFLL